MNDRRSTQIRERGVEYIDQILTDREEETLHLEFKTLSRDGGQLTKEDKRTIGKAVGGLANAEGGVLILGIETETSNGIDVALAKRPIKNLPRTTNLVQSCVSDALSPQLPGIEVFPVEEQGTPDLGFIVIDVPPSSNRPHYSNSHHQYFRRGSDRTRVLEHSEVRELMFAVREGNVEVVMSAPQVGTSVSSGLIAGQILLSIRNIGPVPVTAPYLKITPGEGWTYASGGSGLFLRQLPPNTTGFYTHDIIHVDDQLPMAARNSGVAFVADFDIDELGPRIMKIRETRDEHSFWVNRDKATEHFDRLFGPFEVTFGAMNVPPKKAKFDLSKWEMFEMFAKMMLGEEES
jgi:Putative DNA-binding domain